MKVSQYWDNDGSPTEEYKAALKRQNGKKTRAIRARLLKGLESKKQRRFGARHGHD